MGALGLLLILQTHALTARSRRGGLVAGSYTLALGFSNPVLARIVDRAGRRSCCAPGRSPPAPR
jgi:MFS family permease